MTLFLSTSNPRTMNKLQFPAASPSSRPPHTPQVCRLPPGLLPSHRSSPTTTPRFPAAGIRPLHTHLHSGSPPPPRAPPRPDSPASPRPRARAHTHTFSRFPNLLPRTETSQLRGNSARPAEGIGTQECARSAPSRRASRSPRLPTGKREDTATPPPPRTYHLCVCCSVPPTFDPLPGSVLGRPPHSPEILRALQAHPPPPRLSAKPLRVSQAPRSGPAAPRVLAAAAIFLSSGSSSLGGGVGVSKARWEGAGKAALAAAPALGAQGHSDPGRGEGKGEGMGLSSVGLEEGPCGLLLGSADLFSLPSASLGAE